MRYAIAFLLAFVLVMVLMPIFTKLAEKLDFTDKPTERKKHTSPVPLVGGAVMFIAFAVGFIVFVAGLGPVVIPTLASTMEDTIGLWALIPGGTMILTVGLIDDFSKTRGKEFPVWPRMLVQIAAAVLAFAAGIRFTGFMNPFTDTYVYFHIGVQFALTVLWFVGLVTVFNFMDGLDGLSGLLAMLSGCTLFVVALVMNQSASAFMAVLFIGATTGFLRHNLPPAKVYMGDSGAYLLGYLLAAISLHGAFKQATVISVFIPILAMGVPIFESIRVFIRRLLAKQSVTVADSSSNTTYFHHRLVNAGVKPPYALALIVLVSVCLNLTAIILMLAF
ncbi:MAG: undecaprenyl/decaprenyl-phosphate alpha-N-acetylglucosaminyl 1-phosphate transferase [Defluviitaleaceae bacterium]|nr:undecaprenyl/decaprenyl-phosphate alpha-N-acetylglucosaminyl 1-phosphate transferase [Defluviitaleaceae bacterium]